MLKITAYYSPETVEEAVALLAGEGRTVIAGGTDLLVNPRYMVGVREVVDIRRLGLGYIRVENGWLRIGAGTTMRMVAQHPVVQELANGILARGAAVCGSTNIRHMATLAGNVADSGGAADGSSPRQNAVRQFLHNGMLRHHTHRRPRADTQPAILHADIPQPQQPDIHHLTHTHHVARVHQQVGATRNHSTPFPGQQSYRFLHRLRAIIRRNLQHKLQTIT